MIAYHAERAQGGVGLIINESARFHESSRSDSRDLFIAEDAAIPHFARLAEAVHRHGAKIFGQLSHAGRVTRRMRNGMRGVVYAPSAVPDNRFHTIPREMPAEMVEEIMETAGLAAGRYAAAGYDGVEIVASHGLLFAQFLNPLTNLREDQFGGSDKNRLRPLRGALRAARQAIGSGVVLGLRISADEQTLGGLDAARVRNICRQLAEEGLVDYVNTTLGSMSETGASVHVVPPMEFAPGYVASHAAALRSTVNVPVFVAGRINDPQIAERILAAGQADMCAMTRALITDPELPRKAATGQSGSIRACIGCNQGCIGHFHSGTAISCIQNPRAGRETEFSPLPQGRKLRLLIAGAGPAGLKAAVTAAEAGHQVILAEAAAQPGGQVRLAQLLPGRAEFGGLVTNLLEELRCLQVPLRLNTRVNRALIQELVPDAVIIATGAQPYARPIEGEGAYVLRAVDVLTGSTKPRGRVVIADWRCDQLGIGLALQLAQQGHPVRLAVAGSCAGQNLQQYLRVVLLGRLHDAGIEIIPQARIYGADADTAWFLHTANEAPITLEDTDSLILAEGHVADRALERELSDLGLPTLVIGDALQGRTAEEAVFEGYSLTRDFLESLSDPA